MSRGLTIAGFGVFLLFLFSAAFPSAARAEDPPIDMILVLDISGSMGKVDRSEPYKKILDWVEHTGKSQDRIGVLAFGSQYQTAAPLTGFDNFDPKGAVKQTEKLDKYTNLAAGLENAYYLLKTESRKGAKRAVLLFSDGRIDLPGAADAAAKSENYIRNVLVPAMKREDMKLFAFTPEKISADFPFLQEIVESTEGGYFRGMPDNPERFRAALLTMLRPTPPKTPLQKAQPVEKPSTPPPVVQVDSGRSFLVTVLIFIGGVLVVLLAIILIVQPAMRSKRRDKELSSILDDVRELRREIESSKQKGQEALDNVERRL